MTGELVDTFPLCASKTVPGSRRLAREKILQILAAFEVCETELDVLYHHIFFREFNFEETEAQAGKLLTPQEIQDLEADVPINWNQDEIDFAYALMNNMVNNKSEFDSLIQELAQNWDMSRIALIDRLLIHMATAEFIFFPEIPVKVSINEVIEVGKDYSTDKSNTFINGILDKLADKLKNDGRINKQGRGLSNG